MISYTLLEFDELQSTSDFLKENHSYFPHMTIIRSDYQTKGRGQFDRIWSSNKGENLLFSILLKNVKINQSGQLKRWIMEGLITFFQSYGISPEFKEPNDLYVQENKIAGILIESLSLEDTFDVVVIGIGLNINQTVFDGLKACSLKTLTKRTYDLHHLFKDVIETLLKTYQHYLNV